MYRPNKKTSLCNLLLLSSVLAGCASQKPVTSISSDPAPTGDVCAQLSYVFESSADGFRAIREQATYHNKITIWQSAYQPLGNKCEIWQWSNRYSYVCSRVLPDEQTALNAYNQVIETIDQCLDKTWQQRPEPLPENKGEQTQYLLNGQVRGSVQRVNTKGLFAKDWTVYVLINSPES
ncbi:MAG: hypothetical protein ACR2PT_09065 [Endozoicomonas sp.]